MSAEQYFVYLDGAVKGPYASAEIRSWNLGSGVQVCRAGTEEWQLLSQVGELLPPPSAGAHHSSSPGPGPGSAGSSGPGPVHGSVSERIPVSTGLHGLNDPALPDPGVDMTDMTDKKKIFIIHGRGNMMDDAFEKLIGLVRLKIRYYKANFYVDSVNSNFVRYILYDVQSNPYTVLFDKIIVGKMALSLFYPPSPDWAPDATWTKLSEFKVSDKLAFYRVTPGISGGQREWCDSFFQLVWAEFSRLIGKPANLIATQPGLVEALTVLRLRLRPADGGLYTEKEYKQAIRSEFREARTGSLGAPGSSVAPGSSGGAGELDSEPFISLLVEFQKLNDAGGDLDTIASNALYGAWVLQAWEKKFGKPPRYGKDFEFDFVNYHQSFLHLARHKNCEIYLPDFPMEAIPDLEEAAQAIIAAGSFLMRIDDHHPMGQDKFDLLERLKAQGFFGDYFMSGPVKGGAEQGHDDRTCGADLVHREMIAHRGFDAPGLEELRRLAHQQDLHLIADPDDKHHPDYLAIDLSKLIGSKHSRIDMAQQLMYVRSFDDIRQIMERTGWRGIVDGYEAALAKVTPRLLESMVIVEFIDPVDIDGAEGLRGTMGVMSTIGKIVRMLTFGKVDMELDAIRKKYPETVHRIFMTLAPFQSRKEPRINVASAINFMKNYFRFDYFFYAWGSSLLSTRRYNDKDQSLDLSMLMSVIGGPGDGGHPSAATCSPPSNASWPAVRFKSLKKGNFLEYARYIASKIESGTRMKITDVRECTLEDRDI